MMVAIAFLAFGSVDNVYAVDFVLSDMASCLGLPGGGEVWAGTTCTKSDDLNLPAGDTLTVTNGVTLEFSTNANLINQGDITNDGIITIEGNGGNNGQLRNQNNAAFTNSGTGTITITGTTGSSGRLLNSDSATFSNSGTITIMGTSLQSGWLFNRDTADFTNSGEIILTGIADESGRLTNDQGSAAFTNSGTITLTGTTEKSGWILNQGSTTLTNSGTITITGTNNNSGQLRNQGSAVFTNSGTITLTGANALMSDVSGLVRNFSVLTNSGSLTTNFRFDNNIATSEITNSGILQVTLELNNINGFIFNDCDGEITFGSISGNPIQEETYCPISLGSNAYEDSTIGKSHDGKQVVKNGICIDIRCWTVTAHYHQDFDLVKMLSDSTHTISTTVFCQRGVSKCNYVAFGVSPYGTNINDSVWKIILQKDHRDNWTMKVIDPQGYLGEVTSTTQIVNDNRFLSASVTIEFKKPTPGMILNIEVRDSGGGYRDFKFNDGIAIADAYAYPSIETSYEQPLEIAPLCLNENSNKRYTCAFGMVRDWTIKNAEATLEQIIK